MASSYLSERTFGIAEVAAGGHLAADVSQGAYHRQTFAVTLLMLELVLVPVPRQQCVLHLVAVERVQLSGRHHTVQHQICTKPRSRG